MAYMQADNCM